MKTLSPQVGDGLAIGRELNRVTVLAVDSTQPIHENGLVYKGKMWQLFLPTALGHDESDDGE
jgi:hypothetical protein